MSFPDEPLFHYIHWLIDTPSLGGIVVVTLSGLAVALFVAAIFWVVLGAQVNEDEVYTYPTPTLLGHKEVK